jgi:hypothetical protein
VNQNTIDALGRTSQERAEAAAVAKAADEEAARNWGELAWHKEMADVLTQTIYEGFRHENLLSLLTTVETVAETDRITIEEVKGLRVFWVSLGGHIEQSTMQRSVFELQKDIAGFHVSENEDKMRVGFARTSNDIVNMAIQRMDSAMNAKLIRIFQQALPETSPFYASAPGVSLTQLDTMIDEVMEESEDEFPAIVGLSGMVNQVQSQLREEGGFLPETNEQIIRTGVIGVYRGCRLIRLRNFKDELGRSFFPRNELYVAGRDASKFGFWGGLRTKEWIEQGGWYWHLMGRRLAGGALYRPERVRRFVDTSRAA